MKGTSTFEDLLTDCCGRAVRVDLDNDPHRGGGIGIGIGIGDSGNGGGDGSGNGVGGGFRRRYDEGDDAEAHDKGCGEEEYDDGRLVDVVHVSAAVGGYCIDDICSVEVELANDGGNNRHRNHHHHHRRQRNYPLEYISDAHSSAAVVASASGDNVLLFPSSSTAAPPSRSRNSQEQSSLPPSPDAEHSPSDEYMENHGIETEANRSHKLRGVHEGVLHCARVLLDEISSLIEEYAVTMGYDVVCTGHSLGAGAAILVAVLLRGRYPTLATTGDAKRATRRPPSFGDDDGVRARISPPDVVDDGVAGRRVRAYAFAPPPVLDRASSLACRHYVTSVVNNSDIIPRSSLTNLDAFLTILEAVRCRLSEGAGDWGILPRGRVNSIASIVALFCKLCEGTEGELVLTPTELRVLWDEAIAEASLGDGEDDEFYWDEEFGHHLFVPGKLLLMYESCSSPSGTACTPGPDRAVNKGIALSVGGEADVVARKAEWCSASPISDTTCDCDDRGGGKEEASGSKRKPDQNSSGEKYKKGTASMPAFHAVWTDGTVLALRGFEIGAGSGMVSDHLTSSYQHSLNKIAQLNS